MYRLTWDGVQVKRSGVPTKKTVQTQRVYRWGDCWGYSLSGTPIETAWFAERRILEAHAIHADGTKFLLERVESLTTDAPPMRIDDVWDEEVILLGQGSMVTTSMSVVGSKAELTEIAVRNGATLPPDLGL